jgi:hypothetical protein
VSAAELEPRIVDRILNSAAGRAAIEAEREERAAARRALTGEREALIGGRGPEAARLAAAVAATRAERDRRAAALAEAETLLEAAERDESAAGNAFDRRLLHIEGRLRETAPGAIAGFLATLPEIRRDALGRFRYVEGASRQTAPGDIGLPYGVANNKAAILAAFDVLDAVAREASALALESIPPADVDAALERLAERARRAAAAIPAPAIGGA